MLLPPASSAPPLIDVRPPLHPIPDSLPPSHPDQLNPSMRAVLRDGLAAPPGSRSIPTILLYDEAGLNIYDKITTDAKEYYLFAAEEQILTDNADEIIALLHAPRGLVPGESVVELGAGSLRKTRHILTALANTVPAIHEGEPPITYYALDLEKRELNRTLSVTEQQLGHLLAGKVATAGMLGTYEDGLAFIRGGGLEKNSNNNNKNKDSGMPLWPLPSKNKEPESGDDTGGSSTRSSRSSISTGLTSLSDSSDTPLYILFLGSSLGNFGPNSASAFLRNLPLRPGSSDKLLIGLDHDNDKLLIESAYNDPKGITKQFIMNGLKVAGRTMGDEAAFNLDQWDYVNFYNESKRRHEAYYRSKCQQTVQFPSLNQGEEPFSVHFDENELVHVEYSYKYSDEDTTAMFSEANLRPIQRWTDNQGRYSLWLLERPPFDMPLIKHPIDTTNNPFNVPTIAEWNAIWKAWDLITLQMIPQSLLHVKPIDLRHKCLFYLGHIPTFLDIHLSRFLKEPHTEPEAYKNIFERGIDPNVDDPTQCHAHSEVPQKDEDWPTLEEILDFRDRVRSRLMKLYKQFEDGSRPLTRRAGRVLSMTLEHEHMHAETLLYMLLQVANGSPGGALPPPGFTAPRWELMAERDRQAFKAFSETRVPSAVTLGPITLTLGHNDRDTEDYTLSLTTDHSFGWDNESPLRAVDVAQFKIEWRPISNGQYYEYYKGSEGTPLPASWIAVDGDIYVRTLYGPVSMDVAYHWPVIASYDDLSTYARVRGGRIPTEPELRLFFDTFCNGYLGGMNVGFRNWHPIAPTAGGPANKGHGHNGGVWEWTSSTLDIFEGFTSSELYPGYSSDFFDTHHQVVLGGSYVTPPRLGQRRTFRNWYQHNYPYAWVGARIAYDV